MSSIGSPSPFFLAGKKAYQIERSLRFNGADGPYLESQPSSHSDKKKNTFSFWFKRAVNTNFVSIFRAFGTSSNRQSLDFVSGGAIRLWGNYNGSVVMTLQTSQLFRDFSAWYHFVLVLDTEQGTASNRAKMYVNGVQITDFSNSSYPPQDFEFGFNDLNVNTQIGVPSDTQCNFYIAEFQAIDGLVLDPSYFAETDAITGQWIPKKYVGSYGTNGFYLNFADNSGTTATTLGKDSSGVGRNFTPNNFAVSDAMKDSPTNNFATMNPLTNYIGLSEGNLRFNFYNDSAGNRSTQATIALPKSGKWYWEARYSESGGATTTKYFGVGQIQMNTGYITAPYVYYDGGSGILRNGNASDNKDGKQVWYNGTGVPAVLAMAVDVDNNSVEYFHNGSSQGTIPLPTLTSSQEYFFTWANTSGGNSANLNDTFNFGADSTFQGQETSGGNTDANGIGDFKYAPPTGHLALCSANLPDPTILLPNKHFDTFLYTATGNAMSFPNELNFQPDWIWQKSRNSTGSSNVHYTMDAVRGGDNGLVINSTNAEFTGAGITFTSNGYDMGASSGGQGNASGNSYVSWNWNAGDTDGKTYTVKVHNFSGNNRYIFDDFQTEAVSIRLAKGGTYIFNMDDSSNASHPFSIGTAANGTVYTSGITYFLDGVSKTYSQYTSGFAAATTRRLHITVPTNAPVLYYWCSVHSGMGGQVDTNSDLGSSNFDGTTQSLVKVNQTAGFSIVLYTGQQNASDTIGHGLGVKPQVVITKSRNATYTYTQWYVHHHKLTTNYFAFLNTNSAVGNGLGDYYIDSSFSSTVFAVGDDIYGPNVSNNNYVAYCFSEVEGYSKFGSYTGNGSSDGPFVYTGFRPAWLIIKETDQMDWVIDDTTRSPFNESNATLFSNLSDAEYTGGAYGIDILSNGFKPRTTYTQYNQSGGTYIYLAFAESPFKYARAR